MRADSLFLSGGKWTPHDLRRNCSTLMVDLGVTEKIADLCLYHIEPVKLKRIYQRGKRETEMRDAWRILGERLELLTGADDRNVVMLSLRAA